MTTPAQPGDQNEAGPGAQQPLSRSAEFGTGMVGDPGSAASSLNADSARQNAMVPHSFQSQSVLQSRMQNPGGNGMSAGDASRRLADGTPLGSVNGTSESSFEPSAMLRLQGVDSG